jgi:hypothetical protein
MENQTENTIDSAQENKQTKKLYYVTGGALAPVYCFVRAGSEDEAIDIANSKISDQWEVDICGDFPGGPEWCLAEETDETTEMNADGEEVVKLQRETLVDELPIVTEETEEDLTQIQSPCQRHTRRLQSEPCTPLWRAPCVVPGTYSNPCVSSAN